MFNQFRAVAYKDRTVSMIKVFGDRNWDMKMYTIWTMASKVDTVTYNPATRVISWKTYDENSPEYLMTVYSLFTRFTLDNFFNLLRIPPVTLYKTQQMELKEKFTFREMCLSFRDLLDDPVSKANLELICRKFFIQYRHNHYIYFTFRQINRLSAQNTI